MELTTKKLERNRSWVLLVASCVFAYPAQASWPESGVPAAPEMVDQTDIAIASDGQGGAYVAWNIAWNENLNPRHGTYVQRLTQFAGVASGWPNVGLSIPTFTWENP